MSCQAIEFAVRLSALPRLRLPDKYRQHARDYLQRCTFQAAAQVWAEGVPWPEALELARRAIEKAYPAKGKSKGKGKNKGKGGRPLPKAKGRGKG